MTRISVFGAGSWGTALAALLARNGADTLLWGRDPAAMAKMAECAVNTRYLPDIPLPKSLHYSSDLDQACQHGELLLLVVPSHSFAELVSDLAPRLGDGVGVAWATKGFEPGSGRFLHEVAEAALGTSRPLALVTGPSFAREVALGLPTAVTVHGEDEQFTSRVAGLLHGSTFRAYTGADMIGAELAGAMKNVLAVATGVCDGMQLGSNGRAGLITRGLNEMLRLNAAIGGRSETLMGLAGVGDLVLTCTGDLSRNRRLGLALGRGTALKQALAEIGQVVESVQTVDEIMRLARRHDVELPIAEHVQRVLHEEISPEEGLKLLLAREPKAEYSDEDSS